MSECICKDYGPVSDVHVYGLHESIKKAKYPMSVNIDTLNATLTNGIQSLAQSGIGEGHDQWLTGIVVEFDLTYTVKAWTDAERYRFLYFISSQSTMHRIAKFNLDEQYDEHTDPRCIEVVKELVEKYNETKDPEDIQDIVESNLMNSHRKDVARAYVIYRNDRNRARERSSTILREIEDKLHATNVQNQNANVDERSFGGRMGSVNSEVMKKYALDHCGEHVVSALKHVSCLPLSFS